MAALYLPISMLALIVVVSLGLWSGVQGAPQVPCYFIFGDSLVDNGNNNQLQSLARADYLPYGIDFPGGPSGRFSNGKTTVDAIAELLGFDDYIPPYADASGDAILKGVNYASAAAGIREETGQQLGGRISFSGQVQNYQSTVSQVVNLLGNEDSAANYLSKCIYSIGLGSNDYLNNYFMPQFYSSSRQYSPDEYADVLIQAYTEQLKTLYNYGARKMVLFGIGQIGCSPNELAQNSPDGKTCVEKINSANQIFNNKLKGLTDQFNNQLPDARVIYVNSYGIFQDIISNPSAYGFSVTNAGCCGVGRNNGQITCLPMQTPCQNRREYLFWDAFHPTEAGNVVVAQRAYSAQSASDAYPAFDSQRKTLSNLYDMDQLRNNVNARLLPGSNALYGSSTVSKEQGPLHRRPDVVKSKQGFPHFRERVWVKKLVHDRRIRFGTWNIGTLTGKSMEIVDVMVRRKINFMCLQETKWTGEKAKELDNSGFKLWYTGKIRSRNGVGIIVDKEWKKDVVDVRRVGDRIIALKLVVGQDTFNVISGYAPQVGLAEHFKVKFWEDLEGVLQDIPQGEKVFLGGDLNGHVGSVDRGFEGVHGGFGLGEMNGEGKSILEFSEALDLSIANTWFKKREEHLITYKSGGTCSQIDFFLIRKSDRKYCLNCKVILGESLTTQHRVLVMDVRIRDRAKRRSPMVAPRIKWWHLKGEKQGIFLQKI
ncbi:GDSL esterase/lipase [Glycine max]|nr:GDSL esterase/lipase [Glycine max]